MPNRSVFPNAIDTFIEHYDLTADDVPKVKKYQSLKQKTSLTPSEATELENLTIELRDKIITAEDWNKFQDALVNMQQFIKDEVDGYIENKQSEMQAEVDDLKSQVNQVEIDIQNAVDSSQAGAIQEDYNTKIGNLPTLVTTDKSSIVNAINELDSLKASAGYRDSFFDYVSFDVFNEWKVAHEYKADGSTLKAIWTVYRDYNAGGMVTKIVKDDKMVNQVVEFIPVRNKNFSYDFDFKQKVKGNVSSIPHYALQKNDSLPPTSIYGYSNEISQSNYENIDKNDTANITFTSTERDKRVYKEFVFDLSKVGINPSNILGFDIEYHGYSTGLEPTTDGSEDNLLTRNQSCLENEDTSEFIAQGNGTTLTVDKSTTYGSDFALKTVTAGSIIGEGFSTSPNYYSGGTLAGCCYIKGQGTVEAYLVNVDTGEEGNHVQTTLGSSWNKIELGFTCGSGNVALVIKTAQIAHIATIYATRIMINQSGSHEWLMGKHKRISEVNIGVLNSDGSISKLASNTPVSDYNKQFYSVNSNASSKIFENKIVVVVEGAVSDGVNACMNTTSYIKLTVRKQNNSNKIITWKIKEVV